MLDIIGKSIGGYPRVLEQEGYATYMAYLLTKCACREGDNWFLGLPVVLLVVATGSCVVVSGFVVTGSSVVGGSAGGVCV